MSAAAWPTGVAVEGIDAAAYIRGELASGRLTPGRSRPGLGLELRRAEAARYEV